MNKPSTVPSILALAACTQWAPAQADVTIREKTTIHAPIVKLQATSVKPIAGDKQRSEMQMSCGGVLALLCGRDKTLEIVRLDRDLTWNLQPKERRYTEVVL